VRRITKLIEGDHRGFQDYRPMLLLLRSLTLFTFLFKIQKKRLFTFFWSVMSKNVKKRNC